MNEPTISDLMEQVLLLKDAVVTLTTTVDLLVEHAMGNQVNSFIARARKRDRPLQG